MSSSKSKLNALADPKLSFTAKLGSNSSEGGQAGIYTLHSIYVFPFGFLSSYALSDRILMTWYPLTNFLSKGFLVKFLTKTGVPTLYFGSVLAYLSLFLVQWILIHLNSSA